MKTKTTPITPTLTNRRLWASGVVLSAVLILAGLWSLPFLYESPSMFYKFGVDKILLRTGKIVGLTAAFLLLLQLLLAGRFKWLDRLFSLPGLYRVHRINAYCLGLLVLIHPVLIFIPDKTWMIPFESRYWPEWVGAALLLVIAGQVVISRWRRFFIKAYQKWQLTHRILGILAMGLVFVHILYVSETFEHPGLPRTLILTATGLMTALWLWVRIQPAWSRKTPFELTHIEPAGKDAYSVELEPVGSQMFSYLPGQFAFLSFRSGHLSKEPHPFTLSSSPSRPGNLQFTIRCCGDWTDQIKTLQIGDRANIQGPFGHFSHRILAPDQEIIFIAGGIGITPMLSMLRDMADRKDGRPITLLWSNQTQAHQFASDELATISQQLTAFRWIPIFSREKTTQGQFGRLDRTMLEALLKEHSRNAALFLCGPPPMIHAVETALKQIGFPPRCIHTEAFGL